jgi:hypothetical protein
VKINIANPATGAQKLLDIDDERRVRVFYDKRMSQEVPADSSVLSSPSSHVRPSHQNGSDALPFLRFSNSLLASLSMLLSTYPSPYLNRAIHPFPLTYLSQSFILTLNPFPSHLSASVTSGRATSSELPAETTSRVSP